jgi:hypothetical protein
MHALSLRQPLAPDPDTVLVTFADLNRARSHRVLDRDEGAPVEAHPWAYGFPRPLAASRRG